MARERHGKRHRSPSPDHHDLHRKYNHRSNDRHRRSHSPSHKLHRDSSSRRSRTPEYRHSSSRRRSRSPEYRNSSSRRRSRSPEYRHSSCRRRSRSPEYRNSSSRRRSHSPSHKKSSKIDHGRSPGRMTSLSPEWDSGKNTQQYEQLQKQEMKALAAIQEGDKKTKRVIVKDRGKFDWESAEDTSQDMDPICQGTLLFGRGFYAGVDRREQKKTSVELERKQLKAYDLSDGMEDEKHWSEKRLNEMTPRDWRIFREDHNISYKGSNFPQPIRNWKESGIHPSILRAIHEAGYKKPTPIQMASIPLGINQRDVIGIARTGSGKTAAFAIPMLMYISRLPKMTMERAADGPYALVMAPTKELGQQIRDEIVKLATYMDINVVALLAAENIGEQSTKLLHGCEIVVATPGRLIQALQDGYAVLNQCNYVVLDEGDKMIGPGFDEQVPIVLSAMPSSNLKPEREEELLENRIYRTTYMFTATMPPALGRLAKNYMRNPVVVTIDEASNNITQRVIMVDEAEKPKRLRRLLEELEYVSAIVFVNSKKQAEKVSHQLHSMGMRVASIHGGKSHMSRQSNFEEFKSGRIRCLIATDIVGRGIDIPDVGHVINYDMPASIDIYVHRIGRTGRAGKTGNATTFLTKDDSEVFYDLKQMLMRTNNAVPPELARHEAAKVKPVKLPA